MHEYRIVHPNGDIRWLRGIAKCTLDASGKVTNLIGATVDITDSRNEILQTAPKQIGSMLDHIQRNWNKQLSVADLAKQVGCSSRQIHRYFAAEGISVTTYVKNLRLRHAHQKLSQPDGRTTVVGVALACCFQNTGHFAREYKAEFGELPSETLKVGRALCLD